MPTPQFERRRELGWNVLPVQNTQTQTNTTRNFLYSAAFYTIIRNFNKEFVFGERPAELADVDTINMQVLDRQRVFLERLDNFPLKKAEYYGELQATTGVKSVRGLSEITGEDWSYIAKILRTLELPAPIQEYLRNHQNPETVKCFHLKRLLELVRLDDENAKFARFSQMLGEISFHALKIAP